MKLKNLKTAVLGTALPFLAGCNIIRLSFVTVAATIGLVGYVVYETGDAAVTGVKHVATATSNAAGSTGKTVGKVIFFNGNFKTEQPYAIRYVAMGTTTALANAGFQKIINSTDALNGKITARTRKNIEISINLKNIKPTRTSVTIRFGVTGDLGESEKINNMITREMDLMYQKTTSNKIPEAA